MLYKARLMPVCLTQLLPVAFLLPTQTGTEVYRHGSCQCAHNVPDAHVFNKHLNWQKVSQGIKACELKTKCRTTNRSHKLYKSQMYVCISSYPQLNNRKKQSDAAVSFYLIKHLFIQYCLFVWEKTNKTLNVISCWNPTIVILSRGRVRERKI